MTTGTPPTGKWQHSFEEDTPGVTVYRPADRFAFPAARREREMLDFGAAGTLVASAPGPDDRLRETLGDWVARGMNRFRPSGASGPQRTIEIIESTPEVLKPAKPEPRRRGGWP
ncbi:MAG TPA: hypothetical protein PLL33_11070 [Paracoccus sp. (in: a-proteobacteria)]|nr:hypothetical protein [Paracoccus sp. (in: a-proteobacteria)]